jgi:hypothetical protein
MTVASAELDPIRSMADLAKLMARLAEPFAKPDEVLRQANVTQAVLEAAKTKWLAELSGNERLAHLYGEIHLLERAELRGEPKRSPPAPAPAETAAAMPLPKPVDETAMMPQLTLGQVMPFVEGKFEPPVEPVQPRAESPLDADGTQLVRVIDVDTLPFVRQLPSQTLKKRQ